ncbi:hypothetical protein [Bacillus sp. BP-3]|uniref:hypothetical protein n=1 Tax=Bacillus sp. BP-3 TaxID=3022773 RepID=UPI00232F742F|nr:hypothetical protein [Bacillus sp. BP-3]MDC2865201.1 hypothetical protein [Bacillus sp. BP-3]
MDKQYTFSLEELAFLLNYKDNQAFAKSLLQIVYDELKETETEKIFLTAAHSLLARNLLTFDEQKQEVFPKPDVETLFNIFNHPSISILLQKIDFQNDTTITGNIYTHGNFTISYQSTNGIVHTIENLSDYELYAGAKDLLQIEIEEQNLNIDLEETLPNHLVEEIGNLIAVPIEEGINILVENGVKLSNAEIFINDIKATKSIYSVMRLDTQENGEIISDKGFFIIETAHTQWILSQLDNSSIFGLSQLDDNVTFSLTQLSNTIFEDKLKTLFIS